MKTDIPDYYSILGVDVKATQDELKDRYRFLSQAFHPDKFSAGKKKDAEEEFKRINEAYQVLSDPTKRARYDMSRSVHNTPPRTEGKTPRPEPPPPEPKNAEPRKRPQPWTPPKKEGSKKDSSPPRQEAYASNNVPPNVRPDAPQKENQGSPSGSIKKILVAALLLGVLAVIVFQVQKSKSDSLSEKPGSAKSADQEEAERRIEAFVREHFTEENNNHYCKWKYARSFKEDSHSGASGFRCEGRLFREIVNFKWDMMVYNPSETNLRKGQTFLAKILFTGNDVRAFYLNDSGSNCTGSRRQEYEGSWSADFLIHKTNGQWKMGYANGQPVKTVVLDYLRENKIENVASAPSKDEIRQIVKLPLGSSGNLYSMDFK